MLRDHVPGQEGSELLLEILKSQFDGVCESHQTQFTPLIRECLDHSVHYTGKHLDPILDLRNLYAITTNFNLMIDSTREQQLITIPITKISSAIRHPFITVDIKNEGSKSIRSEVGTPHVARRQAGTSNTDLTKTSRRSRESFGINQADPRVSKGASDRHG
jgi:hypothetical protein